MDGDPGHPIRGGSPRNHGISWDGNDGRRLMVLNGGEAGGQ